MAEFLQNFSLFPLVLTFGSYQIALWIQKKTKSPICNPLLISIALLMVLILLTLTVFEWIQSLIFRGDNNRQYYILESSDIATTLTLINEVANREQGNVQNFSAETTAQGHRIVFRANFSGRHRKKHRDQFFTALAGAEETLSLITSEDPVQVGI